MKYTSKRIWIAVLLAVALVFSVLPSVPVTVLVDEDAHVHDHTTLVNGVCSCGTLIEATVTIDGTTTCYEKLEAAVAAAEKATARQSAVVQLQRNWFEVKGQGELPTFGIRILGGVFTIDFNSCTIFSRAEHIFQIGDPAGEPCNATVTFTDSSEAAKGRITGSKNLCAIYNYGGEVTIEKLKIDVKHEALTSIAVHNEQGELTIHSGIFQVGGVDFTESYAVKMDAGTVNRINGGSFEGGELDFYVRGELTLGLNSVSGVGASFPGGISISHGNLNGLLAEGAGYWTADAMLTDIAEDATAIADLGDITVKTTCNHSENTNTQFQDAGDGTHRLPCSACGYTVESEAHSGGIATCTGKAACAVCGAEYGTPLGHAYAAAEFTWAEDLSGATATVSCSRCDEGTEGHSVTAEAAVSVTDSGEGTCVSKSFQVYTASVTIGGQVFTDSVRVEGDFGAHSLTKVEAAQPSCEEPGNSEYYSCSACGKYFSDAAATEEVEEDSWVLDPLGHAYEDGTCTRCGDEDPDGEEPSEPQPTEPDPTDPEPSDPAEPAGADVIRISGRDRYQTGMAVADQLKTLLNVEQFSAVVVACGSNFPDALTGSYLASVVDAPILLTQESVDADVLAYIQENLAPGGKIYILGGTAAVSQSFEDAARGLNFQVMRLKGANRYETNLAILREAGVAGDTEILIATGKNYADSLSAAATGLPMLLVEDALTEAQIQFLEASSGNFVILGGSGAVSDDVQAQLDVLGNVTRVKGSSRYGTSVAIAQRYFDDPQAAVLAYAQGFPDGLCGGPLALAMGAPLILTSDDAYDLADTYVVNISTGVVTGGTARISDDTVRAIFDLAEDTLIPKA